MKKLVSTLTASITTLLISAPAYAQGPGVDPCPGGGFANVCAFDPNNIGTYVGLIVQVALVIAVVIALLFIVWGGIKWITSGGDKTKVESARSTIIGAIIGLIVALAAYFIINIVLKVIGGTQLNQISLPNFF